VKRSRTFHGPVAHILSRADHVLDLKVSILIPVSSAEGHLDVTDVFDTISRRDDLPAFLVRNRNVRHEAFHERRFPHLFLGREGVSNLPITIKKGVHGCLPIKTPPVAEVADPRINPEFLTRVGVRHAAKTRVTFSLRDGTPLSAFVWRLQVFSSAPWKDFFRRD
jgi:hypothetical protein